MPHTPEPWYLEHNKDSIEIWTVEHPRRSSTGKLIASVQKIYGIGDPEISKFLAEEVVENAELLVRAPRLARVLSTLLKEVSDGFSSAGKTPMALAMQDAAALVLELQQAGVL